MDKKTIIKQASHYGLNKEEAARLVAEQEKHCQRLPTLTEIAITGALWSEHCSYKSSRQYIKGLHRHEDWVITSEGENAGAVAIDDERAVVFKMESHNHPSYLEPFQGAATGVGGILRDIFTMGAKPIANVNALRFGMVDDKKTGRKMKNLIKGVVHGISHYGNCVGVPMLAGETEALPCYQGNILVNAMTVGLVDKKNITSSQSSTIGDWVVYLGSATGADGIKGAVMASQEFSGDDSDGASRPAVQVGDPFAEKLLMDLCLELMGQKKFVAIQDMGAAGLSSSSAEMADKGGVGMVLDLDKVPIRSQTMRPEDMMLSESQERMLAVMKPEDFPYVEKLFQTSHLHCVKIGEVVKGGRLKIHHHNILVADLAAKFLVQEAPIYDRPIKKSPPLKKINKGKKSIAPKEYLQQYFSSPYGADKSWIIKQYDRLVQGRTIFACDEASAGVVLVGDDVKSDKTAPNKALGIACHGDPLLCDYSAEMGGRGILLEAYRKLVAVGAKPLAFTNNLNFGNPEDPVIMCQFADTMTALTETGRALQFPAISGNVSFYNETAGRAIFPTPVIGAVGLIEDYQRAVGFVIRKPYDKISWWLLGDSASLTASRYEFLTGVGGDDGAGLAKVYDVGREKKLAQIMQTLLDRKLLWASKSCGGAGLLVDVVKLSRINNMTTLLENIGDDDFWFGRRGGYLVAVDEKNNGVVASIINNHGRKIAVGRKGGDDILLQTPDFSLTYGEVDDWRLRWQGAIIGAVDER